MTDENVQEVPALETDRKFIKTIINSTYDLQKIRITIGNRLYANFKTKLGYGASEKIDKDKMEKEQKIVLEHLQRNYYRIADGLTEKSNKKMIESVIKNTEGVINNLTEYYFVEQYVAILNQETTMFKQIEKNVIQHPMWVNYFQHIRGIGPASAAIMLYTFDIDKATTVAKFFTFAGLDVVDGEGRTKKQHHLIDRKYIDKDGEEKTKKSITYHPWLKMKLLGMIAVRLIQHKNPEYYKVYKDYKTRLQNDPNRTGTKIVIENGKEVEKPIWPLIRLEKMAKRYMIKMMLKDLWINWKIIEQKPILRLPHEHEKYGLSHYRIMRDGQFHEERELCDEIRSLYIPEQKL
jgi:hypothetical protein